MKYIMRTNEYDYIYNPEDDNLEILKRNMDASEYKSPKILIPFKDFRDIEKFTHLIWLNK